MSSDLKGLQENNEYLMEINQEFGRENDQLSADLKRYQQSGRENDQLSADLKRYQQSFEPRSNKRKGKKKESEEKRQKSSSHSKSKKKRSTRYKSSSEDSSTDESSSSSYDNEKSARVRPVFLDDFMICTDTYRISFLSLFANNLGRNEDNFENYSSRSRHEL
jgi:hypothetical protein